MFVDSFGDTPRARVFDFLGDHATSDYNKTDLAAKSGLTRQTIYDVLPALLGTGMVIQTRRVGPSQMYRLNTDHDVLRSVLSAHLRPMLQGRRQREGTKLAMMHAITMELNERLGVEDPDDWF